MTELLEVATTTIYRNDHKYARRCNRHVMATPFYLRTARENMHQFNVELQCGVDLLVLPSRTTISLPRWGQDCIVRFVMYGRSSPDEKLTKIHSSDDNKETYVFKHGNGLQV